LLLIDVDDFKTLNDTRGHELGDAVLQEIGARLRAMVTDGDTVARIGADEFAVVVRQIHGSDAGEALEAARLANAIRDRLADPFVIEGARHLRTCSVGITLISPPDDRPDKALQRADLALVDAKRKGRGSVAMFHPMLYESINRRAWVESRIPSALEDNRFVAYYQPTMTSEGGCIGAEALVRWHDPDWGLVSPGEFIPVAEDVGVIHEIGKAVLRQAYRRAGLPQGFRHELVSVALVTAEEKCLVTAQDPELVSYLIGTHHGRARPFPPVGFYIIVRMVSTVTTCTSTSCIPRTGATVPRPR
jgi:diguanylate cyclase (GGDEF)-like protein